MTVVWPDPGADAVVVDSPVQAKEVTESVSVDLRVQPFRITDVPVAGAP